MSAKILSASALVAVAAVVLATSSVAQSDNQIAFVHVAGAQQRLRYLATAKIWSDPGDVTPEMVQQASSFVRSVSGDEVDAADTDSDRRAQQLTRLRPRPSSKSAGGVRLAGDLASRLADLL